MKMQKVEKVEGMIPLNLRLDSYFRVKTMILHKAEKSRRTLLVLAENLFRNSSEYDLG